MEKQELFELADHIDDRYREVLTIKGFHYFSGTRDFGMLVSMPYGADESVTTREEWDTLHEPAVGTWLEWLERRRGVMHLNR